ncbi:hypothetical protein E2C01_007301 [Portunus trituberculatus]|uniref:Uncharacterized protein n=1 Tax=Portunus trituberculatus TaxID=210409 RepID=A0A5B7D3Z1_PORTR|nr:hypothetical protein [Portunus trituberculatus]
MQESRKYKPGPDERFRLAPLHRLPPYPCACVAKKPIDSCSSACFPLLRFPGFCTTVMHEFSAASAIKSFSSLLPSNLFRY